MDATSGDDATEPCPYCLAEIPASAARCRYCTGDLTSPVAPPDLAGFWIGGLALVLLGAIVSTAAEGEGAWIGFVIIGFGGILLQVATIAWGVSIGLRDRDRRTWLTRHSTAERLAPPDRAAAHPRPSA